MLKSGRKYLMFFSIILIFIFINYILIQMLFAFSSGEIQHNSIKTSRRPWYISPAGIALDSEDNLYVGVNNYIMCYDTNGNYISSYYINTLGSYRFMIDKNDNIVVVTVRSEKVNTYNRNGQIIMNEADVNDKLYDSIDKQSRYIENASGTRYRLTNLFGYTKVTRKNDGEVVYRIPLNLYFVKVFIPLIIILFFITAGAQLKKLQNKLFTNKA